MQACGTSRAAPRRRLSFRSRHIGTLLHVEAASGRRREAHRAWPRARERTGGGPVMEGSTRM
eukprot:7067134-Prymnesium_polylepis.1